MTLKDKDGKIIAELPLNPDSYYRFEVTTLWGNKEYELKPTFRFVPESHSKDYSVPSGMVLTKA
ncbi:hypothetical protein IMZ68_06600 [Candidatus Bathyarchaeota archaeon]|nr:hypothetical protein [Candidatus Bathyarchaeota archaeon]